MQPTPELIDALYREQVLQARATPGEVKLLDGPRLFDFACRVMRDGIRDQYPAAEEPQIEKILRERIALQRRLEGRS